MKLEWKKRNFDRHEVMQLELVDAYNESRTIASIVTLRQTRTKKKCLIYDTHCILKNGKALFVCLGVWKKQREQLCNSLKKKQ